MFIITAPVYAAAGVVIGAFIPSIGRKIKAAITKESKVVEAAAKAEVAKVESDVAKKI